MERRVTLEGPCRCPGRPHSGDWVDVVERVPVALGAAVIASIRIADGDVAAAEGLMASACLRFGIEDWSFVDKDGDIESIDWDNIERLLPYADGGYVVADRVMGVHATEILRPLAGRTSTSSPDGQTDGSTSPIRDTGSKPPKGSKPSSPTSTDGNESVAPG